MGWIYAGLLFGGSAALLIGLISQLVVGGRSIAIGATVYIVSRLGMAALRVAAPGSLPSAPRNKVLSIVWLIIWAAIAVLTIKIEIPYL